MMLFWIVTAAMILVALVILAPALLSKRTQAALDRDQQNLVIARERLKELDADKASGALDQTQYEQAKLELEQVLLNDIDEKSEAPELRTAGKAGRVGLLSLLVLVPLLTIGLYYQLGKPDMVSSADQRMAAHAPGNDSGQGMASVEEMLESLVARLKENPQDAEGWFLLGRSLMTLNEYAKASTAFGNLHQLVGDQPSVLLAWADAAAMAQEGDMRGKPAELVRKAVALAPNDATALWLAGMVEAQDENYSKALEYWQLLQPLLKDDPESSQRLAAMIAAAREKGGLSAAAVAPATESAPETVSLAAVKVRVSLAPELREKTAPGQSLFIFATALQGPKMPLAAARLQVNDLPVELTLDDSSAMMPAMKLSNFEQVRVGARISKSGDPITSSGDLTGEVVPVKVTGAGVVEIVINKVAP